MVFDSLHPFKSNLALAERPNHFKSELTASNAPVPLFIPTDFGADPTGQMDSTAAMMATVHAWLNITGRIPGSHSIVFVCMKMYYSQTTGWPLEF